MPLFDSNVIQSNHMYVNKNKQKRLLAVIEKKLNFVLFCFYSLNRGVLIYLEKNNTIIMK